MDKFEFRLRVFAGSGRVGSDGKWWESPFPSPGEVAALPTHAPSFSALQRLSVNRRIQ